MTSKLPVFGTASCRMVRMRAVIQSPSIEKHGVGNQADAENDARDPGHVDEADNKSFVECHALPFAAVKRLIMA